MKNATIALTLMAMVAAQGASAHSVRYVDDDAAPGGDGLTWATAYNDLQIAIADTSTTEIRVAAGLYSPGADVADTFALRSGLKIVGGFGGETVLTGDVLGDDDPTVGGGILDNNWHVVTAADVTGARLARVTIVSGSGNPSGPDGGGGVKINGGAMTIAGCVFSLNGGPRGGAILSQDATPLIVGCDFDSNLGQYGGGVYCDGGSARIAFCRFSQESPATDIGGGIYLQRGSHTIVACRFDGMAADGAGVALNEASARIVGCRFTNNDSILFGGSAIWSEAAEGQQLDILACAFIRNNAHDGPGCVFVEGGDTRIVWSLFANNSSTAGRGSAVHVEDGGSLLMPHNALVFNTSPAVVEE